MAPRPSSPSSPLPTSGRPQTALNYRAGIWWLLVSVPLLAILSVDFSWEKALLLGLSLVVASGYYAGARVAPIAGTLLGSGTVLAAAVLFVAGLRRIGCSTTGQASCSVEAISAAYLVVVFLALTVVTAVDWWHVRRQKTITQQP